MTDTNWIASLKKIEQTEEKNDNEYTQKYDDNNSAAYQYDRSANNNYSKQKGEKTMVYVSHLFSGLDMKKHPYAHLKVYVWNRDKKKVLVKNLMVEVLESNPRIYGLYEPIE